MELHHTSLCRHSIRYPLGVVDAIIFPNQTFAHGYCKPFCQYILLLIPHSLCPGLMTKLRGKKHFSINKDKNHIVKSSTRKLSEIRLGPKCGWHVIQFHVCRYVPPFLISTPRLTLSVYQAILCLRTWAICRHKWLPNLAVFVTSLSVPCLNIVRFLEPRSRRHTTLLTRPKYFYTVPKNYVIIHAAGRLHGCWITPGPDTVMSL